jgi:plasmid maintenance system antidote protein VapI
MRERMSDVDFPALVRQLLASGHTTVRLAAELGVSQPAISRLATGKQRSLGANAALRLIELAGGRVQLPVAACVAESA